MVRSPVTANRASPAGSIRVERKVMVGKFSASKKSGDRRWASRFWSRLLREATSMVASTLEVSGLSPTVIRASTFSKLPRTLVTIRWRPTKPTWVWDGSRTYSPGATGRLVVADWVMALSDSCLVNGYRSNYNGRIVALSTSLG